MVVGLLQDLVLKNLKAPSAVKEVVESPGRMVSIHPMEGE
jgi:hypothetical protein